MTTSDKSKMSRRDRLSKVLSGAQKHFAADATFKLAGVPYTLGQLVTLTEADISTSDTANLAKAGWLKSVQVQRDSHLKVDPVLRAFHSYVLSQYGDAQNAVDTLADFGYTPRKPRSKDVAAKNTAAIKLRATRTARGTTSAKKKKSIKGAPEPSPTATTSDKTGPSTATPPPTTPAPAPKVS